ALRAVVTAFLLFLLFCPPVEWGLLLVLGGWLVGVFFFLMYFYRAPERVVLPLWMISMNAALFAAQVPRWKKPSLPAMAGLLFLALVLWPACAGLRDSHRINLMMIDREKALNQCLQALKPRE